MTKEDLLKQCNGWILVNKEVSKMLPSKVMIREVITENIDSIMLIHKKQYSMEKFIYNYAKYKLNNFYILRNYIVKIINVKVEKIQNISEDDIYDEGTEKYAEIWSNKNDGAKFNSIVWAFKNLWNSTALNGYRWEDNPYVFVYEWEYISNI